MTSTSASAGWYPDPNDPRAEWYWDGAAYTESRPLRAAPAVSDPTDESYGFDTPDRVPLLSFQAKLDGVKTDVDVFAERIEWHWSTKRSVSAGKLTAGFFTAGVSLAVTGVGKGSYAAKSSSGIKVVRLETVTHLDARRVGGEGTIAITTPHTVMRMSVPYDDMQRITRVIGDLVDQARKPAPVAAAAAPVIVNVNSGPSNEASLAAAQLAALSSPDIMANLERLGDLRYKRLITDAEFEQMKAKLLGNHSG